MWNRSPLSLVPHDRLQKLYIKARSASLPEEWLWAERLDQGAVKVQSSPWFSKEVAYHDVVACSSAGRYLRVLDPGGYWTTQGLLAIDEDTESDVKTLVHYFRSHQILIDVAYESPDPYRIFYSLAVPYEVDAEQLRRLAAAVPVPILGLDCGPDRLDHAPDCV